MRQLSEVTRCERQAQVPLRQNPELPPLPSSASFADQRCGSELVRQLNSAHTHWCPGSVGVGLGLGGWAEFRWEMEIHSPSARGSPDRGADRKTRGHAAVGWDWGGVGLARTPRQARLGWERVGKGPWRHTPELLQGMFICCGWGRGTGPCQRLGPLSIPTPSLPWRSPDHQDQFRPKRPDS